MNKILILAGIVFCIQFSVNAQVKIDPKEILPITGNWVGSLTYLDYTSNKPYTMPANIEIKPTENSHQFLFIHSFPNEKNANWTDTVYLSSDGKKINEEIVKKKRSEKNGVVVIVTEFLSKDGNDHLPALIRTTYTLSTTDYIKKKEVRFIGKKKWILRHTYTYKRVAG